MAVTILRNASVLDPERGELAEGQSVVIDGNRIADVGPGLTGPDDAVVFDVAGQTVMPGLIDAHTHPAVVDTDVFAMAEWPPSYVAARAGRALEGMLARGFTTIRDVGGGDFGLARAVEDGYFTGPRIRFGGKQLSQTGGAGDWRAPSRRVYDDNYYSPAIGVICDGVPEVRRAVREEVRRGAHHIKVYLSGAVDSPSDRVDSTQFSLEELRAIVEEATAANIYVAGHAYTSRAINRGLECGVRSIEHGNLMDSSSIPLFKQYDAFYVPTIVTYHTLAAKSRAACCRRTSPTSWRRSSTGRSVPWRWLMPPAFPSSTARTCSRTCMISSFRSSSSAPRFSPRPTSSGRPRPPRRSCWARGRRGRRWRRERWPTCWWSTVTRWKTSGCSRPRSDP